MEKTLKELAGIVGGELDGDGTLVVKGVAALKDAGPGDITFLANPKYLRELGSTRASAVIAAPGVDVGPLAAVRAKNPYFAFAKAVALFAPVKAHPSGVMDGARVSPDARLGEGVTVYPNAFVEAGTVIGDGTVLYPGVYVGDGSSIGRGCTVYPNVVIREGVSIGDRVIIHGGTVIGADGFGYATEGGRHNKIPQIGGVVIEDDVELGANVTVDRGALGNTVIKRGSKIDNLVMIAHNVVVGEDSIIVAQVGVSGSTELGRNVVLAGQVGLVGHIKVGDGVMVGAKSGVSSDLAAGQAYSGIPAIPHKDWLKVQAVLPRLPELRKLVKDLEKRLEILEKDKGQ
ncbi:MAG: UDP-3-O-(3-hydroxymyristoyl)glucosamine N-acyltransferase [Nitrospirae bacterium]|nr:UDP-3-O-(3-hydroxymyristoyl)glucosamine N-acyltransferase [Nitrospirota bacterium]